MIYISFDDTLYKLESFRVTTHLCVLTTSESRAKIWPVTPVASAAVHSKAIVLLLLIHCL